MPGVAEITLPHPMNVDGRPSVLLVEDDAEISRMLVEVLAENGFTALSVASAAEMEASMAATPVDLVVLDIMLPGEDGLSICRRLRAASTIPIIMLTARGADVDRIVGLEIGADDYVTKPFNSRELVARIRALLRRAQGGHDGSRPRLRRLVFYGWRLDLATRQLRNPDDVQVATTTVEFDLLAALCQNPGRVMSRDQLVEMTHGRLAGPLERSIDVHISRIRQKIEPDPREPTFIKTVRLGGYLFTPPVSEA
ncbi:response regulator [Reyranella sp.]|uniref:response regulator n=1 Tax=Reyranella sp. TaxID=1929291 RepID=UPI002723EBF2|nr:response regulator [Reyranella sp.]MDO8975625.1 response regulator [Reyranella sp.]